MSKSIIYSLDRDEFQKLCYKCDSLADIIRSFGLHVGAGNYKTLKNRIKKENIDIKHINLGLNSRKGKSGNLYKGNKGPELETILIKDSSYKGGSSSLKKRLIKADLLNKNCAICNMKPVWNGKPLIFRLDHINGISNDNRIENLRLICPNCDSQLPTFSGRNTKNKILSATG